jgi:hypothetical protein
MGPVLGFVDWMEAEIGKGGQAFISDKADATSIPPAASVRPALGDFVFPAKTYAAIPPSSGLDDDFYLINKHR